MFAIEFKGQIISPTLGIDDFPPLIIASKSRAMAASVSGAADMTVLLPVVDANNFKGGDSSIPLGIVPFTLELTPPDADIMQITFTGRSSATNQNVLATQIDGVGIEVRDKFSRRVSPGSPMYYPVESFSTWQYSAGYIHTSQGDVASGDISATVQVQVRYLKFVE